jgi:hypothetical protein
VRAAIVMIDAETLIAVAEQEGLAASAGNSVG